MSDRLLELLRDAGRIDAEAVARAEARQAEAGGALDTALLELGLADGEALLEALAEAADLPPAPPEAFTDPDPRARRVFPARVAERHGIAPFAMNGRDLSVVTAHPPDLGLLDEISFMLSLHLTPHVAPEWRVRALVRELYGIEPSERLAALESRLREPSPGPAAGPVAEEAADAAAVPSTDLPGEPPGEPVAGTPGAPFEAPAAEPAHDPVAVPEAGTEAAPAPDATGPVEASAPPVPQAAAPEPEPIPPAPPPPVARSRRDEPGFSTPRPRPPPARPAPPARPRSGRWTLEEARQALADAADRDAVIEVALRHAREFFEYAAVLAVGRDRVAGYDARGADGAAAACRRVSVPLADPGLFRTPIETRAPYLGPPPVDAVTTEVLARLGRGTPRTVLLHPVFVRDRAVCVLYADNGEAPVSASRLGDLFVLLGGMGSALERAILSRKRRGAAGPPPGAPGEPATTVPPGGPAGGAPGEGDRWTVHEPARSPDPFLEDDLLIPVEVDLGDFEVAPVSEALSRARASDVAALVARLAGSARGSPERGDLVAALARHGEVAAAELVSWLPGPAEGGDARPHGPVEEAGPIPAALAAVGAAARAPLEEALESSDPARRRLAVLLLGRLADAEVLPHVAIRALDGDPDVAGAAREALVGMRHLPQMATTVEWLRGELGASSHDRADRAALALAHLGEQFGGSEPAADAARSGRSGGR